MKCSRFLSGGEVRLTSRFGQVRRIVRGLFALGLLALVSFPAQAQVNVLTYHNDIARTGQNTNETILTPANVNTSTFGKLFSYPIDGYAYAQPLYVANLTMGAGTAQAGTAHNVFLIATENDSVYAFDADNNGGPNASPLWKASLIDSAHGAGSGETAVPNVSTTGTFSSSDIVPKVGITGTPVIDPATNTMYVVSKSTISNTTFFQRLHALDITTGQEKFGGPVNLTGSVAGNGNGSSNNVLKFDLKWENNRPGLLLLNGIVYIGFGSHGDNGPWHGWILAYNAATLHQTSVFCFSPNGEGSGIWQGGAALAADVPDPVNHPYGRMFVTTGNGTYDATTPYTNGMDFGDDDIRLDLANGVITVQDAFTPSNQANLSSSDQDLGSGGPILLPPQTGAHPNELVQVGKSGTIYVVDRDNMGGFNANSDNVVQELPTAMGGVWGMPAYWNGNLYFWGRNDKLRSYTVAGGKLTANDVGPDEASFGTPTPSISSDGTNNGILWAIQTDAFGNPGSAILRAYDATDITNLLYASNQNSSRDAGPLAVKFTVPTIANGKVYVGGQASVSVYGLLAGSQPTTTPVFSPAGQSFTNSISVTITDTTPNATIFYTTDGTTPTAASTAYTGPITVTTTQTITAIATATGLVSSQPASQTYINSAETLAPTFNPPSGAYVSTQTVTLADGSPSAKIYFTMDGSTPTPGAGTTQLYSAPLVVSQTTTIKAIATATGLSNSPVATAVYTIGANFTTGFAASASSMIFNGSTGLDDTRLQLTDGGQNEAGSAFFSVAQNIQNFTTDFGIQLSNPAGDGMTFTIQNVGPKALGPSGGGLGYGPAAPVGTPGILNSIAIKFDLFSNVGEGMNSTGLYTNGASPTTPAIDLTPSGINLHSGSTINAHIVYDGANLTMTLTDTANNTFTQTWPINIPQTIGSNTAYVGFTGGTGGSTSSQKVETWTFTSTVAPPPPPPPPAADFTMKAESASLTVAAGAQGTSTIMVAPSTGSTFGAAVALTCAVTGATAPLPTCSLSPASVTPGSQGATSTLTVSVAASAVVFTPSGPAGYFDSWKVFGTNGSRLAALASLIGAIMLLLALSRYQRAFRPRYAWLTVALFAALCQTSCGGGGGTTNPPTTPPETSSQTYTVTVTGVSTTASSVKIQHAATITVTVP